MAKIAVIGAGLSGLASAHRLAAAGHEVVVLESGEKAGGRCSTVRRDGFLLDQGPEIIGSSYSHYLALVHAVGLQHRIVPSSTVIGTVRGGKVIDTDAARIVTVILSPVISWRAKFRLMRGVFKIRRELKVLDAYRMADWPEHDDEQVTAQARSEELFGREVTDYLVNPLIRMIAAATPSRVSQMMLLGGLRSWSTSLLNITGGLDAVPQAVAAQLDVRYRSRVLDVAEADDGVEIKFEQGADGVTSLHADFALLSCQLDDAARMSQAIANVTASFRQRMRFARLIDIKLAYSKATHSKAGACQVPSSESHGMLMYDLAHNKAPDRAPAGHSLITIYVDDGAYEEYARRSDAELEDWARGEIEKLYPELSGHFLFSMMHRYDRAGYLADPGYFRRTAALLRSLEASNDRIELGGDFFGAASMEAAVLWGDRAADRLIDKMARRAA